MNRQLFGNALHRSTVTRKSEYSTVSSSPRPFPLQYHAPRSLTPPQPTTMPLTLRRKGSLSSMLSGKGHRRSASDSSLSDKNKKVDASASAQAHRSLGAPLAPLREQVSSSRPPPSAFRGARPAPPSTSPKGKERAPAFPLAPAQQRPGRAHWVIDPLESRRGAEVWAQQNRVILVLGGE